MFLITKFGLNVTLSVIKLHIFQKFQEIAFVSIECNSKRITAMEDGVAIF